nr:unnamed protein product [Callosobruchus chinensis]
MLHLTQDGLIAQLANKDISFEVCMNWTTSIHENLFKELITVIYSCLFSNKNPGLQKFSASGTERHCAWQDKVELSPSRRRRPVRITRMLLEAPYMENIEEICVTRAVYKISSGKKPRPTSKIRTVLLICALTLLLVQLASTERATRRRLRRPQKSSSDTSLSSKDQDVSSSITKPRRTRPAHRKASENSLTTETKSKDGYKDRDESLSCSTLIIIFFYPPYNRIA